VAIVLTLRKLFKYASVIISLSSALILAAQKPSPGKKSSHPQSASTTTTTTVQQVVPPPAPLAPPTLEQQPAIAPQVSFNGGVLTIVARNSSLGSILQDVQSKTGATVDMPGSPAERVAGQFGPGPARDVLAALLNGSHFNYVLMGSPQNPNSLEKVVLIAKSSGSEPSAETQNAGMQPTSPRPGAFIPPDQDNEDMSLQESPEEMPQPEQQSPEEQAGQNNGQANGQAAVKTPQQLLQELQRQQQQVPQGPPPGAAVPH